MNRLHLTIAGLFFFLSILTLTGCYTFPEEYPYEEAAAQDRRKQPVYDYEIEYERALRYRASEPRAHLRRSLPPWTEEHERAWQRQKRRRGYSHSVEVDESAPIYLGLTPLPERSALASKASGRSGLSYPERKGEMTKKAEGEREPQSQQQNTFILVLPSQKGETETVVSRKQITEEQVVALERLAESIVAMSSKVSLDANADERGTATAETSQPKEPKAAETSQARRKKAYSSTQSRRISRRSYRPSTQKSENSNKRIKAQEAKTVKKEEIELPPPTPPDYIDFWLYIRDGTLRANRYSPINYPGNIRVESYQREGGLVVVNLASTFNPKVKWRMVLPRADGEHNVKAILVSK